MASLLPPVTISLKISFHVTLKGTSSLKCIRISAVVSRLYIDDYYCFYI